MTRERLIQWPSARLIARSFTTCDAWTATTSLFLFIVSDGALLAQEIPPNDVPQRVEVFQGAKVKNYGGGPGYPVSERVKGREGWVNLQMMVDPDGKPYEIVVSESSGNKQLERAAIDDVKRWVFYPATLQGKPVHSSFESKQEFRISDARGASRQFIAAYETLSRSIEAGKKDEAERQLRALDVRNLHEDAFKGIAQYHYATKWGTEAEQLAALKGAVAEERAARYLPAKTFAPALESLLLLQLKTLDLGGAVKTWGKLKEADLDQVTRDKWQRAMDEVEAVRSSDRSFSFSSEIRADSTALFWLLKRKFSILVSKGHVEEVKLRCDKKYVFFKYEPGLQYELPDSIGTCSVQVIGDPATEFELIQS